MDFSELGVASVFVEQLNKNGLTVPTAIQVEVFPLAVGGKDLRILSKTGTGKTLSYVLPIAQRFLLNEEGTQLKAGQPLILVIVPTRELAFQVASTFETLGYGDVSDVIVGGEPENVQITAWKKSVVGIATPGRILDLLDRNQLDVAQLKALVFDEADRLIDMGFVDDIRRIYKKLPKGLQIFFASATMNLTVDEISYEFGVHLERVGVEEDELTVKNLEHKISFVGDEEKFHALTHYLKRKDQGRGIVFSNYRERAHDISKRLRGLGWAVEALSAQLNQDQRNRITERYRSGEIKILIASDLASRGLDFLDIDFVVNYDLPEDPAIYVHRVGRTARAGKKGEAISLVGFNDSFQLEKLENFLGMPIPRVDFAAGELSGKLARNGEARHSPEDRSSSPRPPRSQQAGGQRDSRPERDNRGHRRSSEHHRNSNHGRSQQNRERKPEVKNSLHVSKPAAKPLPLWSRILNFFGLGAASEKVSKTKDASPVNADQQRNSARTPRRDARRGSPHRNRSGGSSSRRNSGRGRSRS